MTKALGAYSAEKPLERMSISRRSPGLHDVQIKSAYCGVCHSDLHTVHSEWGGTIYPCMPGHEIVGHVAAVGSAVLEFNVGDAVGVGCKLLGVMDCRPFDDRRGDILYWFEQRLGMRRT